MIIKEYNIYNLILFLSFLLLSYNTLNSVELVKSKISNNKIQLIVEVESKGVYFRNFTVETVENYSFIDSNFSSINIFRPKEYSINNLGLFIDLRNEDDSFDYYKSGKYIYTVSGLMLGEGQESMGKRYHIEINDSTDIDSIKYVEFLYSKKDYFNLNN